MSTHEELVERVAKAIAAMADADVDEDYTAQQYARAVLDVLAPDLRHDPPEGCEAVWLPKKTVDWFAVATVFERTPGQVVADACRDAQARRPSAEPRTERVPWWEAVGRRHPLGEVLASVRADESDVRFYGPDGSWICDLDGEDDGKVEVLAEDGAE